MPALLAESGARRWGDQMLRRLGHVVKDIAFEELWQNALRRSATVKAFGCSTPRLTRNAMQNRQHV